MPRFGKAVLISLLFSLQPVLTEASGTEAPCAAGNETCVAPVPKTGVQLLQRASTRAALSARDLDKVDADRATRDWVGASNEPVPFVNIDLATFGYNVYYADPAPPWNPALTVNQDPGLRRPVFAINYNWNRVTSDRRHIQPDGYHASIDLGCSSAFSVKTISDEFEYTKAVEDEVGVTAGVEAKVEGSFPPQKERQTGGPGVSVTASVSAGASASLSYKGKQVREGKELQMQSMQRSVARCAFYTAAIDFGNMPQPDRNFDAAVNNLWNAEFYYDLFDNYGTHFLTMVKMGARYSLMSYYRKEDYQEMQKTAEGWGMSVSVGVQATASLKMSIEQKPDEKEPSKPKRWESSGSLAEQAMSGGLEVAVQKKAEADFDLFGPKEAEAAKTFARFVQKFEESSVGPRIPLAGLSAWLEEVKKAPVPVRFDRREICLHPSFEKRNLVEACQGHLRNYCVGRLKARGAPCEAIQARECSNDMDCGGDTAVCRAYKCVQVPVCRVRLCRERLPQCGESYTLPDVTSLRKPLGQEFDLTNGGWADKVKAIELSHGCQAIEAVDDDGACSLGKEDNGRYTTTQTSLPSDLENDICMIKVWAKDIPTDTGMWSTGDKGASYRGQQTQTRSGRTCQAWAAQTPQRHQNTASRWPAAGLEANYCRNPDNSDTIWCYTTDPLVRWDYCDPEVPAFSEQLSGNGQGYRGRQTRTRSGKLCQEWSKQVPQSHQYLPSVYPLAGLQGNFCRNPDGANTIWCFTTDPAVRWEFCDPVGLPVPVPTPAPTTTTTRATTTTTTTTTTRATTTTTPAPRPAPTPAPAPPPSPAPTPGVSDSEALLGTNGRGYRGRQSRTRSGKLCQSWSAQAPQPHQFYPSSFPNEGLVENYCRNPDGSNTIWCYTVDAGTRWEYCDPMSEAMAGVKGSGYRGRQTVTRSGKTCQSWSAQSPQRHDRIPANFPSAALDFNFCRNPDGSDTIWCYTTDPGTRWEYCNARPALLQLDGEADQASLGLPPGVDEARSKDSQQQDDLRASPSASSEDPQPAPASPGSARQVLEGPGLSDSFLKAVRESAPDVDLLALNGNLSQTPAAGRFIKNVGKAFFGYNNYFGAPLSAESAGTDPGFQHRPVWVAEYSQGVTATLETFRAVPKPPAPAQKSLLEVPTASGPPMAGESWGGHVAGPLRQPSGPLLVPNGWRARVAASPFCESKFETRSFKSQFDYELDMSRQSSLNLNFLIFSFEMSSEEKEFRKSNGNMNKMMTVSTAECLDYVLEMDNLATNPPPTNPSFKFVVDACTSEEEFYTLFDLYGLHFPTSVAFGARYGYTRFIDENNYKQVTQGSKEFSMESKVNYAVGALKGMEGVDVDVGASMGIVTKNTASSEATKKLAQYFSEVKEFSVGKKLPPNGGGARSWVNDVSGDPMPIRFELKSLCEHPVFAQAGKKSSCQQYAGTYCEKRLRRLDDKVRCAPPVKPQCLWDLDCPAGEVSKCVNGFCLKAPGCTVEVYSAQNLRGVKLVLGPIYRATGPVDPVQRLTPWWTANIRSVKVSGGCEEVTLLDQDACMPTYADNLVVENRRGNADVTVPTLEYDLDQDVCAISMTAKAKWV